MVIASAFQTVRRRNKGLEGSKDDGRARPAAKATEEDKYPADVVEHIDDGLRVAVGESSLRNDGGTHRADVSVWIDSTACTTG